MTGRRERHNNLRGERDKELGVATRAMLMDALLRWRLERDPNIFFAICLVQRQSRSLIDKDT